MSISPRTVGLVAKKELLEAVRDRRTLFVALILPVLLYPIMMIAVGPLIGRQRNALREAVQKIAVTGEGRDVVLAEVLIEPPIQKGETNEDVAIRLVVAEIEEPLAALESGEIALWIDAPLEAQQAIRSGGTGSIVVYRDSSNDQSLSAYEKWKGALARAEDRLVEHRLKAASLPGSFVDPIEVERVEDVASAEERAGFVFGKMLALILVLMTMSSSFYPAVDVVAGEKERGTMETLLVAPCGRAELVLGKYLAVLAVTLSAALLNLLSMWLTLGPLVGALGVPGVAGLSLSGGVVLGILSMLFPLAALFSAMSIGLSTLARSVKEAQHYLTPLFLLVMPLAMVVVIPNVELSATLAALPITNVVLLFRDLMIGKADVFTTFVVFATTAAAAGLALWATVQLFLREETLFRGPENSGPLLQRPKPSLFPPRGAVGLLFASSLALIWYAQPLMPVDDFLAHVLLTQSVVVLAPCVLLAWWLRVDGSSTFRIRKPRTAALLLAVPIGFAAPIVNGFLQRLLFGEVALEGPFHELAKTIEHVIQATHWSILLGLFAITPAICEELVYRGFIMSGLSPKSGARDGSRRVTAGAVIGAAALFALFHIYPEKWMSTFLVGVVLGLLAVAGRSIWPAVVAHAINNGSIILIPKLDEASWVMAFHDHESDAYTTSVILAGLVLAASLVGVVRLLRTRSGQLDAPAAAG